MAADLTIPADVLEATAALRQDRFSILKPRTVTSGGGTTPDPAGPQWIGPFWGEFWDVSGDELVPAIAEARGTYRLAVAREMVVSGETITIDLQDQIAIGGRIYDVAWNPDPSGLDLTRVIGLKD